MGKSPSNKPSPSHHGRLSTTDASFLYFERESAPMHIGALAMIDGEIDAEAYLAQIDNRLRLLPRFKEKVVPPPFYVGHPTWETDPHFALSNHMIVHQLEAPGGPEQLRDLTNRLIEGQLDRSRPLWEIHLIRGLKDGRTALVSKVHHAMVDGVGGNAIMLTLFDLEPEPPAKEYEDRYVPSRPGDRLHRLGEAMWDNARGQIDMWSSHLTKITEIGQATNVESIRKIVGRLSDSMPDLLLPPRRLPFNKRCTGERDFTFTRISFAEARAIRRAVGGTVNDVVLTVLAGALSRYARLHGQPTEGRTARVMVPVNVRPEGETANLGNLVSILPVRVPLDIEEPVARLQSVRTGTRSLKESRVAEGVSLMTNLGGAIPAPFQAAFGAIAVSPYPIFNLVCTNVPGPQIPLYAQGQKLVSYYPIVPVGFDMGVCCAIFSYERMLHIGLNSDVGACDDIDCLRDFIDQSFAELRTAALGEDTPQPLTVRRVPIHRRPTGASSTKGAANARKATNRKERRKKRAAKSTGRRADSKQAVAEKAAKKKAAKKKAAKKKAAKKKVGTKKTVKKKGVEQKTRSGGARTTVAGADKKTSGQRASQKGTKTRKGSTSTKRARKVSRR